MALTEEDVTRANAEMARLRTTTATAVAACYDRRISRIVIRLSSGLEVAFSPHDAEGLEKQGRLISTPSRSALPGWEFIFPSSTLTFICRRFWKACWGHAGG